MITNLFRQTVGWKTVFLAALLFSGCVLSTEPTWAEEASAEQTPRRQWVTYQQAMKEIAEHKDLIIQYREEMDALYGPKEYESQATLQREFDRQGVQWAKHSVVVGSG